MAIIVFVLLVYFIRDQFEYSKITRLKYYFIPLFSLFQVFGVFTVTPINLLVIGICLIVGMVVGHFQAKYSSVKRQISPRYFYFDEEKKEQKIYENEVLAKGGHAYLIGWVTIFGVQVFLQFLFVSRTIDLQTGLFKDLLEDIFSVYRIQGLEDSSSGWYAWALYGFSSLFYYFSLCKKFPIIKQVLLHSDGEIVD